MKPEALHPSAARHAGRGLIWLCGIVLVVMAGCSSSPARRDGAAGADKGDARGDVIERGRASWYGPGFHGKKTASGERFDMNELTAAHRTLPFGTRVRVRNTLNGREVMVRINDRGPHTRGRIIDLSKAAAVKLDLVRIGEAPVLLLAP